MQHAVCTTKEHAVAIERGHPRPPFLSVGRKIFAAAHMDEPQNAVMVVDDGLVPIKPTDEPSNGLARGA
jgi:hypothetical protein